MIVFLSEAKNLPGLSQKHEIDTLRIMACGDNNGHDDSIHPRVYTTGLKKSIIDLPCALLFQSLNPGWSRLT